MSLQLYASCFKHVLDNGHVEQAEKNIVFTCHAPAEALFKALGSVGVETLDEGNCRRGVFRPRYMKPPKGDRCYEQMVAVGGAA